LERATMSHYLHSHSLAGLSARRSIPWRAFFNRAVDMVRMWARRQRRRHELLDFMAIDHRAAADIGVTGNDAREWAQRPFWRA